MHRKTQNLILIPLSLLISALILEVYFRYFYIETDDINITLSSKKWKEKYCKYNNEGFRDDRDFNISKPKGTFKMGVLGDSYVFGQGIKNGENRFSNILERLIRDNYNIKCEVYNMGKGGWSTLDERNYFFEKGIFYKFDALILCSLEIDDFLTTVFLDNPIEIEARKHESNPFNSYLLNNSYAFSFLYAQCLKMRLMHLMGGGAFVNIAETSILEDNNWQKYFSYIEEIKSQCERNGITFYVISFEPTGWGNHKRVGLLITKFERRLKSYLDKYNIKYIFLKSSLSKYNYKDLVISLFDFHPNELVNRIAAEQLLNLMKPQLEIVSTSVDNKTIR